MISFDIRLSKMDDVRKFVAITSLSFFTLLTYSPPAHSIYLHHLLSARVMRIHKKALFFTFFHHIFYFYAQKIFLFSHMYDIPVK